MGFRLWGCFALLTVSGCEGEEVHPTVPVKEAGPNFSFGVLPAVDVDTTKRRFRALDQELTRQLKRPLDVVVADSYDALVDDLKSGKLHAAQMSPYVWVTHRDDLPPPLAQQRMAQEEEYCGVFVVKDDSKLETIADLKGKSFAYVSDSSSAGYIYPRMHLKTLGLDPDRHFGETRFAGSHQNVAQLVSAGEVHGGAISWQTLPEALNLRVLERTALIPDDVIVPGASISEWDRGVLTDVLTTAHKNPKLASYLAERGIARYIPHDPKVFAPLERELRALAAAGSKKTKKSKKKRRKKRRKR